MASLFFSDFLKLFGIDAKEVKLLRHALSDKGFHKCFEENMVLEYTRCQKEGFSKGYKYWAVFISDHGTYARFYGLYRVDGFVKNTGDVMPQGFPFPEWFTGEEALFALSPVEAFEEYRDRLFIDWGRSVKMWHQKGTTPKEIIALRSDPKKVFPGFDEVVVSFEELSEIIRNESAYADWRTALSSIKGIYLISDTVDGRMYIGSAYGSDGLWGRWKEYVQTGGHGNNRLLQALLQTYPERCKALRFSILQILPMNGTDDKIIETENLWKRKLLTREFGYNKSEVNWEQEMLVLSFIRFLRRIAASDEYHTWCKDYSVFAMMQDKYEIKKKLSELTEESYEKGLVPTDYYETVKEAGLDERLIGEAEAEWLAKLSTKELIACIAYHFRRDHFAEGSLINRSIADGAMLRMMEELQRRR
jgi:hypothetical protein